MKMQNKIATFLFFTGIFSCTKSIAQDLEKFKTADPLHVNGNISWNQMFYGSNRIVPSRQPQTWVLNGNINFKLFDVIQAPFSFNYSNLGNQFTQPNFNQSSFHPTYKWATLHVGTISQSWGAYTVNGHVFRGAALELTPGKFSFSCLYGRFQKATQPDTLAGNLSDLAFKRMGQGIKLGWNGNKTQIATQLFHAKDEMNSIRIPEITELTPKENYTAGFQWQQQIGSKLHLNADLGYSSMQEDIRIKTNQLANYKAIKASANYSVNAIQLNAGFERIDPGYRTLGAYFFNNDLQNITTGVAVKLFKNKIAFNGNIGKQHDNLDGKKRSQMQRTVGSATVQINGGKRWSANGSYSNFLSYTNQRAFSDFQNTNNPYLAWDTLNFRQISENINGGINFNIKKDSIATTAAYSNISHQRSADRQNGELKNGSVFYNISAGFTHARMKDGLTFLGGINASQTAIGAIAMKSFAPVISITKTLFKKQLRSSITWCQMQSRLDNKTTGNTLNLRANFQYTYHKKHIIAINCMYLKRDDIAGSIGSNPYTRPQQLQEWTIMINYAVAGEIWKIGRK